MKKIYAGICNNHGKMILEEISKYIAVDEIIVKNSEKYVHFISRADDLLEVPNDWTSQIYTSKLIIRQLLSKDISIPIRFLKLMDFNIPMKIKLRGGISFLVMMLSPDDLHGNVMFYFKSIKTTVLYTGCFTEYENILKSLAYENHLQDIEFLYIDNTKADCCIESSTTRAAAEILRISQKHPEHKILMQIPSFGYESLLLSLINECKMKVFINELQLLIFEKLNLHKLFQSSSKDAVIIVVQEDTTPKKVFERFKNENIITLRIIEDNNELKTAFENIGLFQVYWSPHPSLFTLHGFIDAIGPKHIKEIFSELPKIPKYLKDL